MASFVEIPSNVDVNRIEYIQAHFDDPNQFDNVIILENSIIFSIFLKEDTENTNDSILNTSLSSRLKELVIAPRSGLVSSTNLIKDSKFYKLKDKNLSWLLEIVPCTHPTIFSGSCVLCGEKVRTDPNRLSNFRKMDHSNQRLMVEIETAKNIGIKERNRLLSQKKLSLVLDLDHTLLHAVDNQKIQMFLDQYYMEYGKHSEDILPLFIDKFEPFSHFVKLRPYLKQFLKDASDYFELHVVTHGTRLYANAIARIIDPTKEIFGDRIMGREDCEFEVIKTGAKIYSEMNWETGEIEATQGTTRKWIKKVSHLFPQGVNTVLIIDDTLNVWREDYDNVIQIKPYHFFVASRDINNSAGSAVFNPFEDNSLSSSPESYFKFIKECLNNDDDVELLEMLDLLKRIHSNYFNQLEKQHPNFMQNLEALNTYNIPIVNKLLSKEKMNTFKGLKFVFSRIIPLNQDPKENEFWKEAEAFGAKCQLDINEETTHIITDQRQTSKVKKALETPGVNIVHIHWFLDSKFSYKAKNEFDYYIYSNGLKIPVSKYYKEFKNEILTIHDNLQNLSTNMRLFKKKLQLIQKFTEGEDVKFKDFNEETKDLESIENHTIEEIFDKMEEEIDDFDQDFDDIFDEEFEKVNNL